MHPHDLGPRGLAEPLSAALATSDRAAVARALRDGPVVVPHLTREDGTPQVRVFPAPEGSTAPYQACLFTTPAVLADFSTTTPDASSASADVTR